MATHRVMDRTGDTRHDFDIGDPIGLAKAEERFRELTGKRALSQFEISVEGNTNLKPALRVAAPEDVGLFPTITDRRKGRSELVVDPATGALVVTPDVRAKVSKALRRAKRQLAVRLYFHLVLLYFDERRLDLAKTVLCLRRYFLGLPWYCLSLKSAGLDEDIGPQWKVCAGLNSLVARFSRFVGR